MVNTSNDFQAVDRASCPHYRGVCEWRIEFWRHLKTTGYENLVCLNCDFHLERRPLKELTDIVLHLLRQSESEPNVFDIIGHALTSMDNKRMIGLTMTSMDNKRWYETPQEVGHGENISKDTPSLG